MLRRTIIASYAVVECEQLASSEINEAESRRRMSSDHYPKEHPPRDVESPFRRKLLLGTAALSATALLPPHALAQQFPTAKVNTTGLAVTDTDVTVGIL